jgi:hypothetical protein
MVTSNALRSGVLQRETRAIRSRVPRVDRFVICNGLGTSPDGTLPGRLRVLTEKNRASMYTAVASRSLFLATGYGGGSTGS